MLQSFHNDEKLKSALLKEIKKHRKADRIIQGTYGFQDDKDFKGCAVGCSVHSLNIIKKKDYQTFPALPPRTSMYPHKLFRCSECDTMTPPRLYTVSGFARTASQCKSNNGLEGEPKPSIKIK